MCNNKGFFENPSRTPAMGKILYRVLKKKSSHSKMVSRERLRILLFFSPPRNRKRPVKISLVMSKYRFDPRKCHFLGGKNVRFQESLIINIWTLRQILDLISHAEIGWVIFVVYQQCILIQPLHSYVILLVFDAFSFEVLCEKTKNTIGE